MKLYTHNFLRNNSRDVESGYPLGLVVHEKRVVETPFRPAHLFHLLSFFHWEVFLLAAESCGIHNLPPTITEAMLQEEEGLAEAIHSVLFDIDVVEGELVCPETGKVFPIHNGIPDMM